MHYTILGGRGFIGGALAQYLKDKGHQVDICEPNDILNIKNNDLGCLIYAIGLTADFRTRITETLEAHVSVLKNIIDQTKFNQLIYLSSTRMYSGSDTADESQSLKVDPSNTSDFYNITKIMGEAYCLQSSAQNVKIVRLSNVVGFDPKSSNFVNDVINEALDRGEITLNIHPDSEKDFIVLDDVLETLESISVDNHYGIFNIASGINTSLSDIAHKVADVTGVRLNLNYDLPNLSFPHINNSIIKSRFNYTPRPILDTLETIINQTRNSHERD
jgi:nucleoside-diphosphate-sugar epimerase